MTREAAENGMPSLDHVRLRIPSPTVTAWRVFVRQPRVKAEAPLSGFRALSEGADWTATDSNGEIEGPGAPDKAMGTAGFEPATSRV